MLSAEAPLDTACSCSCLYIPAAGEERRLPQRQPWALGPFTL